jgi:hypothetical protein
MSDMNDHDLLITLHEKVTNLITKVDKLTDDHERRIRFLERYMWSAIAVLYVANILLGYYLAIHH